jgi:GTPase
MPASLDTKCGFVSIIGRPNVGKSTLLNAMMQEKLALVSHKSNATRKRFQAIGMYKQTQMIFVDTPGLHEKEKLLNQFMLEEALRAIGDCDLILFLADATDSLKHYEHFLTLIKDKTQHILVLNKIDQITHDQLIQKIAEYSVHNNQFLDLVSISATKEKTLNTLFEVISNHLPSSPYLYDPELLTTETTANLYKEFIREALFNGISDEIPYESDVILNSLKETPKLVKIQATIVIEKESQKGILIGKKGATIKRLGTTARHTIEKFAEKKVFLELFVKVQKGWSKNKNSLMDFGYEVD